MSHKTNRDLAIRRLREIYDFAEATQTDHTRYDDFIPRYENLNKVVNSFETAYERIIAKLTDEIEINNEDQIPYQTLVKRYQDKRKLVFMYWEEIVNLKLTITSNSDLRKLLDTFTENLLILETFELPVKSWDFVLFHLLLSKLDRDTRERFELKYISVEIPTFNNLVSFVEEQCTAIGRVDHQPSKAVSSSRKPISKSPSPPCSSSKSLSFVSTDQVKDNKCSLCNSSHPLHKCPDFLNKLPLDRYNLVRASRGCLNCLAVYPNKIVELVEGDIIRYSIFKNNCHLLLLIRQPYRPQIETLPQPHAHRIVRTWVTNPIVFKWQILLTVLLSTTVVQILDSAGKYQAVRALIDQGSQANFITENCLRKLGLPVTPLNTPISGVNQMSSIVSKGTTTSSIKPLDRLNPTFSFKALIVPTICRKLPSSEIPLQSWSYLKDLKFADPYFNKSLGIDILIGAELYPSILKSGYVIRPAGQPSAINTIFGWVLMGRVDFEPSTVTSFCVTLDSSLDSIVRFWELEELPPISNSSPDDIQCEKLYV
ncbi:hypothetical protein NQ315_014276 [Exocentrus adspersus]|uniref:Peptidase aspartic putative domain-containing protein n=1 Tax=Exocentrus adspersus TaxID=1586481 RepID=A0AAV8VJV2_9CUCU|nr:hypothetical protein NQ315_014276 [Exocentrus adspersus]